MNQIMGRQFSRRGPPAPYLPAQPQAITSTEPVYGGRATPGTNLDPSNPFARFLIAEPYGIVRPALAGSDGALGADEQPKTVEDWVKIVGPVAREIMASSATEDVEVLRAKIANQTRMMNASPEPIRTLYRNNINLLRAKLRAALQDRELERESQRATRTWRIAGYTVTGTGILAGLAATVALLALGKKWKAEGKAAKRRAKQGK